MSARIGIDPVGRWAKNLQARRGRSLTKIVNIVGERDKHLGPRFEKAAVEFQFEPAEKLDVRVVPQVTMEEEAYVDSAIFGLLDVLLVAEPLPVNSLLIRLVRLEIDPIDSSSMAFRNAGRDAARKLLAAL